ncbi:hypothetical protein WMY93_002782 [Mugilogobius chulae]|uniref:DRBM domain-containing protein n=1 Tax=Mugilogobius chulae TaxID=88201 RepID=A0AAW0Q9Y3_9GOBI
MELSEENEAVSVEVLSDESSDWIVRTEEGLTRWSQNASLSQALFELAQRENLQVKATSVSVRMVWIIVGDEEVIAEGATREEASVKALSLALEGLKKQTGTNPEPVLESGQVQRPTDPEENEAVSVEVLSDKESSDRIVRTEEGLARWSQNASLSQALFELAQQENLQVKATYIPVCMVFLLVGDEEIITEGATREEASMKALSLALEGLKKQTGTIPEPVLESGPGSSTVAYEEESVSGPSSALDLEEERMASRREEGTLVKEDEVGTEEKLQEEGQEQRPTDLELESKGSTSSSNVVDKDESCVGPSLALESEDEDSDLEGFGIGFFNWWHKDQTVCEEEERVIETGRRGRL